MVDATGIQYPIITNKLSTAERLSYVLYVYSYIVLPTCLPLPTQQQPLSTHILAAIPIPPQGASISSSLAPIHIHARPPSQNHALIIPPKP